MGKDIFSLDCKGDMVNFELDCILDYLVWYHRWHGGGGNNMISDLLMQVWDDWDVYNEKEKIFMKMM